MEHGEEEAKDEGEIEMESWKVGIRRVKKLDAATEVEKTQL